MQTPEGTTAGSSSTPAHAFQGSWVFPAAAAWFIDPHWASAEAQHPCPSQITLHLPHPADTGRGILGLTVQPTDT